MTPIAAFGLGLGTTLVLLVIVWVIQLFTRNAGLVDVVWTASVGIMAAEYALVGDAAAFLRLILAALALTWALRLAAYLAVRNICAPEDARYVAARESWGARADVYMLAFFVLQAVIAAVLSIAFLVVAYRPDSPAAWLYVLALIVWFVSVVGEGTADAQLRVFKQKTDNRGHVCAQGLWRYSRHPNYFFESLHWVAYVLLAIGAPLWWATLISPMLMAVLLLKVSGIPMIENADAAAKRIGHDDYVRRTSAFIPWPPKQ